MAVPAPATRTNVRTSPDVPWSQRALLRLTGVLAPRWTADRLVGAMLRTTRRSLRPEEEGFLAVARRVDLDGGPLGRLATWSWGDAGPRVLLLHGWDGSAADFRVLGPALVAAGASVTAVDGPGHGASDGRRSNIVHMARALRVVADAGGPVTAVVAHSFGAAASALAVAEGLAVERLVLIAPAVDPGWYVRRIGRLAGPHLDRQMEDAMERRVGLHPRDVGLAATVPRVGARVTVIHDRDDREIPLAPVLAALHPHPHVAVRVTEGLGHRRILRAPAVAEAVVGAVSGTDERSCSHGGLVGVCQSCALEAELRDRTLRWA